jgi:hypothetical protein
MRAQARFIEMTRDRIKTAEAAHGPSSRFYLANASQRAKPEGKLEARARRREQREPKKS